MTRKTILIAIILLGGILLASTQITIFVVQPIVALPEGRTLIIVRKGQLRFIESADSICDRHVGGVNLLCRGLVLAHVAENSTILAKLPYSKLLYLTSTGGKTYSI